MTSGTENRAHKIAAERGRAKLRPTLATAAAGRL
jgi:hypothetical protein